MPSANHDQAFRDGVHVHPLRVYYEDTDAAGVVYYANYLKFAERARTEMLRDLGVDPSALAAVEGVAFAVSRCEVDYLAPARLDDELTVQTRIVKIFAATIEAEQIISRGATECARRIVRLAFFTRAGLPGRRPRRSPYPHRALDRPPAGPGDRPATTASATRTPPRPVTRGNPNGEIIPTDPPVDRPALAPGYGQCWTPRRGR